METGSFKSCPEPRQGANGHKRNTGSFLCTRGKNFFTLRVTGYWNWLPRRLWSLLLWRYSKSACTPSCVTCSRELALAERLDKTICGGHFHPLWFRDSVILWPRFTLIIFMFKNWLLYTGFWFSDCPQYIITRSSPVDSIVPYGNLQWLVNTGSKNQTKFVTIPYTIISIWSYAVS